KSLSGLIGQGAVGQILQILATSMLTVTTFSLGIMVSALSGAAGSATPRTLTLLKRDTTTQNALATFLGTFLFSLVGIVALQAGIYHDGGRFILFIATVLVIALIVVAMLRWIAHLGDFGRLLDSISRVEAATRNAIEGRLETPYLGGNPRRGPPPAGSWPVHAEAAGYVQHLDTAALSALAEDCDGTIHIEALPGAFVHAAYPIVWIHGARSEAHADRARRAFTVGELRNYDQDPRFGLTVLAEVASRALSPAVNDPGTAIDVIGRGLRLLTRWGRHGDISLRYPRLWVPEVRTEDLFEDFFRPIARDAAGMVEVQIRLHKALIALAGIPPALFAGPAFAQSTEALTRAETGLPIPADIAHIRALHESLAAQLRRPPATAPER
ncbi:DUF2254 domain-containing protein, partial [Thioclava sp. BHET1]